VPGGKRPWQAYFPTRQPGQFSWLMGCGAVSRFQAQFKEKKMGNGLLQIQTTTDKNVYAIGLRYSGALFTTVPSTP
jgi:hypothetical protein